MNSASFYPGKRVIVTGGLGFIGSNLALELARLGAKVTVIDSAVEGCGANPSNLAGAAPGSIEVIPSDLGETAQFEGRLREASRVFNLAGEISHSRSMSDPERDLALNTVSQLRFLLACRDCCPKDVRILYASTRQVYGKPLYLPVDENHPIQPVDFNGVHKYAATQYHDLLARTGDLDCMVLRLSNVYGPRMALHLLRQGFLGVHIRRALLGEPLLVYGDGEQLRDPVFVGDVVRAFLAAGSAPRPSHRLYNVGGPDALTLQRIARTIAAQGRGSRVETVPFPAHLLRHDIGSYYTDNTRLREDLGISPRVLFEDGIRETVAWFRARASQYLEPFGLSPAA
jgi:nucleoside-diphosphate-sugar epimerase